MLGAPHARSDLALYLLVSVVGYPVVADIARQLGNGEASVLRAQLSILWGFLSFLVIATLVRRRLEVERLARRVATQERLAALGRLASVVAHQTRHLLGVLNMSAYVLGERLAREPLSPGARLAVDRELDAIARTRDELDRLLTRELQQRSAEERFGLLSLARECAEQLSQIADAQRVSIDVEGDAIEILGDRIRLKQAVSNVLRNAIEASPEGSRVGVAIGEASGDARLTVEDRGPGLSPAAREHLFEPLFTEKQGGLGMGLYVARAIVEAHGGTLALEPAEQSGTRATIELPRAA
jgi:signal transduction histidine kinase